MTAAPGPGATGPTFAVESTLVVAFARAIGDDDPVVHDRAVARAAGLTDLAAPLTFVQACAHVDPDHPLRPRPGEPWFGSAGGPGVPHPTLGDTLHAEQHFEYHRPLVVGDVLSWTVEDGRAWTKNGRIGTLHFQEKVRRFVDAAGEPAVTVRSVTVRPTSSGPGA